MNYLTEENFEKFINNTEKVVVSFSADWCGPCKSMTPLLEKANEQQPNRIAKLNVDNASEIAAKFGIRSIPTMIIFQGGQVINKHVGSAKTTQEIVDLIS